MSPVQEVSPIRTWIKALTGEKGLVAASAVCVAAVLAYGISDLKIFLAGILVVPLMVYAAFKRPMIFPLGVYLFLIPFDSLLSVTGNASGTTVTMLLGAASILILVLKGTVENRLDQPGGLVMPWVLFIAFALLSMIWATQPDLARRRITTAIGLLLLYVVSASYRTSRKDYESIKLFIFAGGLLAAAATIFTYLSVGGQGVAGRTAMEMGGRQAGLNRIPFDLLIPVSICIAMATESKRRIMQVAMGGALMLFCIGIVLTGSRGGTIAVMVIGAVYLLSARKKIAVAAVVAIVVLAIMPFIPDFFVERVDVAVESGGDGRTIIWNIGWHSLEKYWLLGAGLDNFPKAYTEYVDVGPVFIGLDRAPHNIFIGNFVELGLIGLVMMVIAFGRQYRELVRARRAGPDTTALRAVFWAMIAASFFQDTLWYKSFWMLWMMIAMHRNVLRVERRLSREYGVSSYGGGDYSPVQERSPYRKDAPSAFGARS